LFAFFEKSHCLFLGMKRSAEPFILENRRPKGWTGGFLSLTKDAQSVIRDYWFRLIQREIDDKIRHERMFSDCCFILNMEKNFGECLLTDYFVRCCPSCDKLYKIRRESRYPGLWDFYKAEKVCCATCCKISLVTLCTPDFSPETILHRHLYNMSNGVLNYLQKEKGCNQELTTWHFYSNSQDDF